MGRVNGVNSDYILKNGAVTEVKPPPTPLELKLFICPGGQKNSLEAEGTVCQGESASCPAPAEQKNGHALVHMHESEGLSLVTDKSTLKLGQDGNIRLIPANTGKVYLQGEVNITSQDGTSVLMKVKSNSVLLSVNGASIEIKGDGSIQLTPKSSGKVSVQGDLEVTGKVNSTKIA